MRVIDARSGREVSINERVTYPDGEWWHLRDAFPEGFFTAVAYVETPRGFARVRMPIRYTHPSFFLQRVAFFPS
jgi:hypothetical protein